MTTEAPEPQDEGNHGVSPELTRELQERAKTPTEQHVPWEQLKVELGL